MDWEIIFQKLRRATSEHLLPSVVQIGQDSQSPFRVLISTVISLRTKDAVTLEASKRLFAVAPSPERMLELSNEEIASLIFPAGFYRQKSRQILKICKLLEEQYQGLVPADRKQLLALPGVGLKTANLTLALGFNIPAICVDTHVHRICNRFGWISTSHADQSEAELSSLLPQSYWIELNNLLVKYGQSVCTPQSPHCSRCTLSADCQRCGVTNSR